MDVSGEWLSNDGSIHVGGSHLDTVLVAQNQLITFDTKTGYFSIEGGLADLVYSVTIPTQTIMEKNGLIKFAPSILVKLTYEVPPRSDCVGINL